MSPVVIFCLAITIPTLWAAWKIRRIKQEGRRFEEEMRDHYGF